MRRGSIYATASRDLGGGLGARIWARTSICEASERDFRVVPATDAVSGLYERGEQELTRIGVQLMSSDAIAAGLANQLTAKLIARYRSARDV